MKCVLNSAASKRALVLAALAVWSSIVHGQAIKIVDVIPASLSAETNQDSEPFLAVQTANPKVMVISAFTPNPVSNTGNAPVYVSQDGGDTWVLNAILPAPRMTCDITHAFATGANHPLGNSYAGTLTCVGSTITLNESETTDVLIELSDEPEGNPHECRPAVR